MTIMPLRNAIGRAPTGTLVDTDNVIFTDASAKAADQVTKDDAAGALAAMLNGATVAEVNAVCDGNTATAAEITRACDLSTRLVPLTATVAITELLHEGRDMYVTGTALATYTLPEATGGGARYRFVIGEVNTSNNVIVVADTTNTNFIGNILTQDADLVGTIATLTQLAPANADTLTFNGTTTGGQLGDWIEFADVATDVWFVTGITSVPAGSNTATPFSAAV